jgi:hypothetical protein
VTKNVTFDPEWARPECFTDNETGQDIMMLGGQ